MGLPRQVSNLRGRVAYLVGQNNHLKSKLHANNTANNAAEIWSAEGKRLRQICRQLVRNNPVARRAQDFVVDRVVGEVPPMPQPRTGSKQLDKQIETEWSRWCRRLDARGHLNYRELVTQWVREWVAVGETFCHVGFADDGSLVCRNFEPDELLDTARSFNLAPQGNYYADGIQYDKMGRPVKYVLEKSVAGAAATALLEYEELPADNVIHIYDQRRPTEYRGLPTLATAAYVIWMVQEADESELASIVQSSQFGLFIKTEDNPQEIIDSLGGDTEDLDGDGTAETKIDWYPGAVNIGNFDVQTVDSNRPGGQYEPFVTSLLMKAGTCMGVPYSALTGDNSNSNYSTERATAMYNKSLWRAQQRMVVNQGCERLYRLWLRWASLRGLVNLRGRSIDDVLEATQWPLRGFEWIDPRAEGEAMRTKLELGLLSWGDAVAEYGKDPADVLDDIERWRDEAEARGVSIPLPQGPEAGGDTAMFDDFDGDDDGGDAPDEVESQQEEEESQSDADDT